MLNLLPRRKRELVEAEYLRRRSSVAGGLTLAWLVMAVVVAVAVLIPLWSKRVSLEADLAGHKLELAQGVNQDLVRLEQLATDLQLLETVASKTVSPTTHFQAVLAVRGEGISFDRLSFLKRGEAYEMEIGGLARTRRGMLDFLERLRENPSFASVESPVSNLIKESDVPFSAVIEIKPNE